MQIALVQYLPFVFPGISCFSVPATHAKRAPDFVGGSRTKVLSAPSAIPRRVLYPASPSSGISKGHTSPRVAEASPLMVTCTEPEMASSYLSFFCNSLNIAFSASSYTFDTSELSNSFILFLTSASVNCRKLLLSFFLR
jgi:hypothetical protein